MKRYTNKNRLGSVIACLTKPLLFAVLAAGAIRMLVLSITDGPVYPLPYESTTTATTSAFPDFSPGGIEQQVKECIPVTPEQKDALQSEIKAYEGSEKFKAKMQEVQGGIETAGLHKVVAKYLTENLLQPGWSVLELGCAAGMMLKMVDEAYAAGIGEHKELVGVEIVTGWVKFAQEYHPDINIYEGDVTEFNLPAPFEAKTFDFVMLSDVVEHIQKERYGCFFQKLNELTHPGSIVYMHTPTPQAQLVEAEQHFENVVPHHYLVMGMALAGFEVVSFEHDLDTLCGRRVKKVRKMPRSVRGVKCIMNKWPKYYHAIFRKVATKNKILELS